jgi:hypothetical protein
MTLLFDKIKDLNRQFVEAVVDTQEEAATPSESLRLDPLPVLESADAVVLNILKDRGEDIIEPASSGIENLYSNVAMSTDFQYWSDSYYGEGNFIPQGIIQDKFRYVSQKFWDIYDGRTMRFLKKDFLADVYVPFSIQIDEGSKENYYNQDGLEETRTTIKLSPKRSKFKSFRRTSAPVPIEGPNYTETQYAIPSTNLNIPAYETEYVSEVWRNYITSKDRYDIVGRQEIYWDRIVEFNKIFSDSTFSINAPHKDNISKNEKYITADTQYNYYHSSFEEISSLDSVDENYMPNLYANYASKNNASQVSRRLSYINTLNGKMKNVLKAITDSTGTKNLFDYYQIFDEWASTATSLSVEEKATLSSFTSHIVLTEDDIEQGVLSEVEPVEKTFPSSIKIEFMGDPVGQVKGLLSRAKATDALIAAVSNVDILGKAINLPKSSINFYHDPNKDEPVAQRSLPSFDLDKFV